jgi:hypothetical protein
MRIWDREINHSQLPPPPVESLVESLTRNEVQPSVALVSQASKLEWRDNCFFICVYPMMDRAGRRPCPGRELLRTAMLANLQLIPPRLAIDFLNFLYYKAGKLHPQRRKQV